MFKALHGDSLLALLLDLLLHNDTVVVAIDHDQTVVSCVVGAGMLGLTSESIIGMNVTEFVSPADRSDFIEACQQGTSYNNRSFLTERTGPTGDKRWWSGTLHRFDDDHAALWFVLTDVTKVVALAALTEVDTKMSALRDLSGSVSHHLNNVIGGALTSIDFALESRDERRMQKTLIQASQLMVKAGSIISGLQIFAVGDQRSQQLRGISDIIDDTIEKMADEFAATQVRVNHEVSCRIEYEAGTQQLTTVLSILLKNAIEATPKGGAVRVCASTSLRWVVLQIIDKGCGIDAEVLPHIFEPFWTTKEQFTTTAGEGTGLGLAMAHGIVTSIGGKIEVASTEGQGTQVSVYWPIVQEV